MIPQVQIPDFTGTIQRGQALQQQGEMSRLQMLVQQRALEDDAGFRAALADAAPALAGADETARLSALARLAGSGGMRGAQIALPMIGNERDRAEFRALMGGAGLGGGAMPAPMPQAVVPAPDGPVAPSGDAVALARQAATERAAIPRDAPDYEDRIRAINDRLIATAGPRGGSTSRTTSTTVPAMPGWDDGIPAPGAAPRAQPVSAQGGAPAGIPSIETLNRLFMSGNPRAIEYAQRMLPLAAQQHTRQTGLQPIEGTDAQGNPVIMFADGRGGLTVAQTPNGVRPLPATREIRLGNEVVTVNRAGVEVGRRPMNNEEAAAATARGRAQGETQGTQIANAPEALRTAEETMRLIDGVLQHPALNAGTGMSGRLLNQIPGTQTFGFAQRVEQLQGRAFLQAFESLKGGGAITEMEGQKATQAIARLNLNQSPADFRAALRELREVVVAAQERARRNAQGGAQGGAQPAQAAPAPAPSAGGVPIGRTGQTAEPPPRAPLSSFQR